MELKNEKTIEQRLRSKARRNGLSLKKSRTAFSVDNIGGYMIKDENNNIQAGERYDMSLVDVEIFLNEV